MSSVPPTNMALLKVWRNNHWRYVLEFLLCTGVMLFLSRTSPSETEIQASNYAVLLCKQRITELEGQLKQALHTRVDTPEACRDDFQEVFDREQRYICSYMSGGIGNFTFSFASVYGMAAVDKRMVVIHKDNPMINYFRVKAQVVDNLCICEKAIIVYEDKHCAFTKDLLNLTEHTNYLPGYYLQSWKYFHHVADEIRTQFSFKESIRRSAVNFIQMKIRYFKTEVLRSAISNHDKKKSQSITTVGVHVRRGDIMYNPQFVDYGYQVAPAQYFKNAMAYFRNKYITPLFFVCSDNIVWCKNNIVGSDVLYVEGNSFDVDLAILSSCNHSVISVGTFGWWSAFLASGETIYYKHPARNGSPYREQFSEDFSDFFYPGWIGMD